MSALFASKKRIWILGILLLFLFKLVFMALFPVIGDEAYYFYWGMHPAGGYYDLPPMIAWWLAPFVKVSLSPLWLRLPNLIAQLLVSLGIYEFLAGVVSSARARMTAALFFFLPFPFFSILMIPDVPLLFFSFFSAFLFFRAVRDQKAGTAHAAYFLSGVLLGAAFLSKYFAVLLIPAFGLWFLTQKSRRWIGLVLFALGGLPFLFQHLYWNSQHCWANFVFNLVTRQKVIDGTTFQTFGFYLLYLAVLSTPFFWSSLRKKLNLSLSIGTEEVDQLKAIDRFSFSLWAVPVGLFGISALMAKGQGIHWLFFVLPFFVIWVSLRLVNIELALHRLMICAGVISLLAIITLGFPDFILGKLFERRFNFEYTLLTHPNEFVEAILPDVTVATHVFTEGYTLSSVLNYDFQKYARQRDIVLPPVSVWGEGSRFGRVYDWTTDFASLEGKNLIILTPGAIETARWAPYFRTINTMARYFSGHLVLLTLGEGFKSAEYLKKEFIKPVTNFYPEFAPGVCSLRNQ